MIFKLNSIIAIGIVLLLVLVSCSNRTYKYSTKPGLSVSSFEFKPNNEFYFNSAQCLSSEYGYGKYEIIGDKVRFKFDRSEHNKIEVNKLDLRKDSIHINLIVTDLLKNKPLPYCTIAIYRDGILQKGFETDNNGYIRIDLAFNPKGYQIQLMYVGMENYSFNTSSNGSYDIKIDLNTNLDNRMIDVIKEYKLIEFSDSLFSFSKFEDSLNVAKLYIYNND